MAKVKNAFKKVALFFSRIDWEHISIATYVRYTLMILTVVNTVLTKFGVNPIPVSETDLYNYLSDIITVILLIVNTYKDNPTSKESIECTDLQRAMKATDDLEEIKSMLQEKLDALNGVESGVEESVEDTEEVEDIEESEEEA